VNIQIWTNDTFSSKGEKKASLGIFVWAKFEGKIQNEDRKKGVVFFLDRGGRNGLEGFSAGKGVLQRKEKFTRRRSRKTGNYA